MRLLSRCTRFRPCFALLCFGSLVTLSAAETPWHEHYARGIDHVLAGEAEAAKTEIEKALALRPEPGLQVPTYGPNYVDYLPHLYLAITAQMLGDIPAARRHLKNAEQAGVAMQSEAGTSLLEASQILLQVPVAVPPGDPDLPESPGYKAFERKPPVLSEEEYAQVEEQVYDRCQLEEDTPLRQAPWYVHYEMGIELTSREDPQRALDAFIEATERRQASKRKARIYGMWFKDYLPYFQIARAHSMLGNWECAADALDVSRSMGEVRTGDEQYEDFEKLRKQVQSQVEP